MLNELDDLDELEADPTSVDEFRTGSLAVQTKAARPTMPSGSTAQGLGLPIALDISSRRQWL